MEVWDSSVLVIEQLYHQYQFSQVFTGTSFFPSRTFHKRRPLFENWNETRYKELILGVRKAPINGQEMKY